MNQSEQEFSMSDHNAHLKKILQNGEWWTYPWWFKDQYYMNGLFDKNEVEIIFEEIKKVFDAGWFLEQVEKTISDGNKRILRDNQISLDFKEKIKNVSDQLEKLTLYQALEQSHPHFNEFFGRRTGTLPLSNLMDLGKDLHEIRKNHISKLNELSKRLKNKDQYFGARFELWVTASLLRLGWTITEPPTTNGKKKADLQANKGSETVIIELKRLESSRTNKEIYEFADWIWHSILRFTSRIPADLNLKLLPDCLKTAKIGTKTVDIKIWREIGDEIIGHIRDDLNEKKWGHHVLHGIAEYDLQPALSNQCGESGTFSGFPIDQEAEAEKIVQSAILEAAEQLPKDRPGIVIINTPFPIDDMSIQSILSHISDPDQIKHIRAVILSFDYTVISGKARYRISLVNNPHSDYKDEEFSLIQDTLSLGSYDLEEAFFSAL